MTLHNTEPEYREVGMTFRATIGNIRAMIVEVLSYLKPGAHLSDYGAIRLPRGGSVGCEANFGPFACVEAC